MNRVAWGFVALGTALRLVRFSSGRGFAHDESCLAVNLLQRDIAGLFRPLGLDQAAPGGFLVAVKVLAMTFRPTELVLRSLPLVASILVLPLFLLLGRRAPSGPVTCVALALMALAEPMIYYSSEFKQYSLDSLITVVLLLAAVAVIERPGSRSPVAALAGLAAVAVWFSHPAVFVIAGVGLILFAREFRSGRRRAAASVAVAMLVAGLSFGVAYALLYHHVAASRYMAEYWERQAFLPFPPGSLVDLRRYGTAAADLFIFPVGQKWAAPAVGVFLLGAWLMYRDDKTLLALFIVPLVLAGAALLLRRYPFQQRLALFAAPLLVTPVAYALAHPVPPHRGVIRSMQIAVAAFLFLYPTHLAIKYALDPQVWYDIKRALRQVEEGWRDGDVLYLHWGSTKLGEYYLRNLQAYRVPDESTIYGVFSPEDPAAYVADLARARGARTWVVFTMAHEFDDSLFRELLDRRGRFLAEIKPKGSRIWLYALDP